MAATPGPWKWNGGDLVASNGEIVIFGGIPGPEWTQPIDPNAPAARLISAAPDLLEACKEGEKIIRKAMEDYFKAKMSTPQALKDYHTQLTAAISKATGEQP